MGYLSKYSPLILENENSGYVDLCYLNRLFTRQYGVTPLQFRKQNSHLYGMLNG